MNKQQVIDIIKENEKENEMANSGCFFPILIILFYGFLIANSAFSKNEHTQITVIDKSVTQGAFVDTFNLAGLDSNNKLIAAWCKRDEWVNVKIGDTIPLHKGKGWLIDFFHPWWFSSGDTE